MRVLGLFPYYVSHQPVIANFSWPLLVYSLSLIALVWSLLIIQEILYMGMILSQLRGTLHTVYMFMTTSILVYIFVIPPYFLLRSSKVARTLASLLEFYKDLDQFIENKLDKRTFFHLSMIIFFSVAFSVTLFRPMLPFLLRVCTFIEVFYDVPLHFIVPVLYNALFRILSLMLSAAFAPLEKLYGNYINNSSFEYLWINPTFVQVMPRDEEQEKCAQPHHAHRYDKEIRVKGNTSKDQKFTKVPVYHKNLLNQEHTTWGNLTFSTTQQNSDVLISARRSLIIIEQLEARITSLLAPPICLKLFLGCISNVTFMICILPEDAKELSLNLMYASAGMLQTYLLLAAPEDYRKKVSTTTIVGFNYE